MKFIIKFIKPAIDRLTPTCEVITEKISKSLDEPLSLKEKIQIRVHTFTCILCARYREQLLAIRKLITRELEQTEDISLDKDLQLPENARERIKDQLRDEL